MKTFRLFRRNGIFYAEDPVTRKQKSLRTRDRAEAERLAFHGHEARRQPQLNLQIARGHGAHARCGRRRLFPMRSLP